MEGAENSNNNNNNNRSPAQGNEFFNTESLQKDGEKMLALIADLYNAQGEYQVQPRVEPGFLRAQFPAAPPDDGVSFDEILKETREKVFPGMKHWQHPGFFAYLPSTVSHAAVLADMFATTFHSPAFVWHASPSITELENLVVDWLADIFRLPECFHLRSTGGGSIAGSLSEAIFSTCHAAKKRKMDEIGAPIGDARTLSFVGYYTQHSFTTCEKSLLVKDIAYRRIVPIYYDEEAKNYRGDAAKFEEMVQEDLKRGLIPFWMSVTLGTTSTCAYDDIDAFARVCEKYGIWLNCDAAYSGVAWALPENRAKVGALERLDSLLINASKLGMVGNVGALLYARDKIQFQRSFMTGQAQLEVYKNKYSQEIGTITDYCNWSVGFGRRFNALKLFYVTRAFGARGIARHLQEKEDLAEYFARLVRATAKKESGARFFLFTHRELTLVCFRLYPQSFTLGAQSADDDDDEQKPIVLGPDAAHRDQLNALNKRLKSALDEDTQKGFITPSEVAGDYFLRFVVANPNTTRDVIDTFWAYLCATAEKVLAGP